MNVPGNSTIILSGLFPVYRLFCEKKNPVRVRGGRKSGRYAGRFDGTLGVVAALEVLEIVKEQASTFQWLP